MDSQHTQWQGEERRTLSHIELQLKAIQASVDDLRAAFPEGDVRGHCEAHKAMIRMAQAQEAFWVNFRQDLFKKGAWLVIISVLGLIWVGFLSKLGLYR